MNLLSQYNLELAKVLNAYLNGEAIENVSSTIKTLAIGQDLEHKVLGISKIFGVVNNIVNQAVIDIYQAKEDCLKLYNVCGFDLFLDYKYFEGVVSLYFDTKEKYFGDPVEKADRIREIYNVNKDCPVFEIKNGVNIMCVDLIVNNWLISYIGDFSAELIDSVDSLTEEEKTSALFPRPIELSFE